MDQATRLTSYPSPSPAMDLDILQLLPCPVLVTDREGRMVNASPDMVNLLLGGADADWHGQSMECFLPPASRVFMQTHVWPTLFKTGHVHELHLKLRTPQGQVLPALLNARLTECTGQPCCIWVLFIALDRSRFEAELIGARATAQALAQELTQTNNALLAVQLQLRAQTQRVEANNQALSLLSQTDPLTGLGNRRMLENQFAQWVQGQPVLATGGAAPATASLLLVDADHFKCVNDQWGHDEGDRVLVLLAQALQASVRRSDLVVRHGGEEFVIFLPDADEVAALRVADQLHAAVASVFPGQQPPNLTVSIGVATLTQASGALALDSLVHMADTAAYQAKTNGRNCTAIAPPPAQSSHPPP